MTHEFTVSETGRIDAFLAKNLTQFSRSKLQRLIEAGHTTVNDELIMEPKRTLREGDRVRFIEPEPDPDFPEPEISLAVRIIYEDDVIMVVEKPTGMVTHPNTFHEHGTLVQALIAMRPEIVHAIYDPESPVSRLRPGIVHRLDKDTSGLVVVAKTKDALQVLSEQFHTRKVEKRYEALLYGTLTGERTVRAPIQRKSGTSNVMVASHDLGQGRAAVTHFKPLETYTPYAAWPKETVTRVEVHIETGRTHQIRVHAKFIGHPVMGDQLYANRPSKKLSDRIGLETQTLRSVYLSFTHPSSGERVSFSLD